MSYTLRRISSQGVQMNFELGNSYTVVSRFEAYEWFKEDFKRIYDKEHVADNDPASDEDTKIVYAFVGSQGGIDVYPLFRGQQAYIMTSEGKTFSNLTIKE